MTDISPRALRALVRQCDDAISCVPSGPARTALITSRYALRAIADRDEAAGWVRVPCPDPARYDRGECCGGECLTGSEGWVRVPVEPTEEMIAAGTALPGPHGAAITEAIYRAMIAAAPKGGEG